MTRQGFEEAQAKYRPQDGRALIGDVRRFGAAGPAYEVTDVTPSGDLMITVIESGERLDYALADVLADPVAATVP